MRLCLQKSLPHLLLQPCFRRSASLNKHRSERCNLLFEVQAVPSEAQGTQALSAAVYSASEPKDLSEKELWKFRSSVLPFSML